MEGIQKTIADMIEKEMAEKAQSIVTRTLDSVSDKLGAAMKVQAEQMKGLVQKVDHVYAVSMNQSSPPASMNPSSPPPPRVYTTKEKNKMVAHFVQTFTIRELKGVVDKKVIRKFGRLATKKDYYRNFRPYYDNLVREHLLNADPDVLDDSFASLYNP